MSTFKKYFTTNCISFTILILVYSLLWMSDMTSDINGRVTLEFFVITSAISVLMFFTNKFTDRNALLGIVVDVLDVFVCVFILGGFVFKMFPLNLSVFAIISLMILCIYFAVYGVMVIKDHKDAELINKELKNRRENQHGKDS